VAKSDEKEIGKVYKNGRVALKKEYAEKAGLKPGDLITQNDIKLKNKNLDRRSFLKLSTLTGGIASVLMFTSDLEGFISLFERAIDQFDPDSDITLLSNYFYIGEGHDIALAPAADHPLEPLPERIKWYEIETNCCAAYTNRFWENLKPRKVNTYPEIRKDDNIIAFGSSVSNIISRKYLGNPFDEKPLLEIVQPDWKTNLHWNHFTPDAEIKMISQYGKEWPSGNHTIVDSSGKIYKSNYTKNKIQLDDYLLVTCLPRYSYGKQRILIFGGQHGAATSATETIFKYPPQSILEEMDRLLERSPYYQALFHITVEYDESNNIKPKRIEWVKARPLDIYY